MPQTLPALVLLGLLALSACNQPATTAPTPPDPGPAKIPGATVQLQLTEASDPIGWTLGAADIELYQYVKDKDKTGPLIATTQSNAAGSATLSLPGEAGGVLAQATLPLAQLPVTLLGTCTSTVQSSAPNAKTLFGNQYGFSTDAGGGRAVAGYPLGGTIVNTTLVFSTQASTLSGALTCGGTSYPVELSLDAGWNIVDVQFGVFIKVLKLSKVPLNTVLKVLRTG